ncbi:uncharacterized protein RCC_08407 [Lecanosticta acicola]|uniref:Uncharacterized protein RCC_08407 n=1 Tax=Lecanosticta acicola TaxID=111012 RepID=A0AAI8Z183_9PEZI|nr:uncharacterized protein RCC_08407 [Lecanosticta acicola]
MAAAPILYQETRTSPTPALPSSILHINAGGNSTFSLGRKRPFDEISGVDEESYARNHLATEGSVFFRPKSKVPHSFSWRILNDRQLLEVQCVDLVLDNKHSKADSFLTFHISLSSKIVPGGVALADVEEKDALEIFVITTNNELYTITLRRDLLVRETVPADFDSATCVKKYSPSAFSNKHPYRFVAFSHRELFVSLHDGSMLKLSREQNESGSNWRETHFSEGGWSGTLKRQLPLYRPRTVRYGKVELFDDAIAAIAKSPDGKYIWTVGLDHVLKAWNAETGKIAAQSDLVEDTQDEDERKKQPRYLMSPEQSALLQIVAPPAAADRRAVSKANVSGPYFIVAHSPKDHRFVFYEVTTAFSSIDGDRIEFQNMQPHSELIPPIDVLLNTTIWLLEHFCVKPGPEWSNSQLWLRARSGVVCKTFMLPFDLLVNGNAVDLSEAFQSGWTAVDSSYLTTEQLKGSADFEALGTDADCDLTSSERWLQYLFYPGRFTQASLETALHIYRKGRSLPKTSGKSLTTQPLKQRMVDAISSKILLRRLPNDQPDYDRYQSDLQTQWGTYFSVLSHLHNRRHESIGFAFDLDHELPWTVCADFIAPARASSAIELLELNADLLMSGKAAEMHPTISNRIWQKDEEVITSQLMAVAQQFRRYFPATTQEKLRATAVFHALEPEIDSSEQDKEDKLDTIYASCGLQDSITDADYDSLNDAAEAFGGLGSVTDDMILAVIELAEDLNYGHDRGEKLARYGRRVTIAIVQETLVRMQAMLLDLLALISFLHCDLEQGELSAGFNPLQMYDSIMLRLKHTELCLWLVRNTEQLTQGAEPQTLYESMFKGGWTPSRNEDLTLPELLTVWSRNWCLGLDSGKLHTITAGILGHLIQHKHFDLAQDFTKFLPDTAWIAYLKGRLYLATGDYAVASIAFKAGAEELSNHSPNEENFLSNDERNYFGRKGPAGMMFYFQHVSSLYEGLKNYAYTADFAALALGQIDGKKLDQQLKRIDHQKSIQDSPLPKKVENMGEELAVIRIKEATIELWNRLFNARVQTGHFELAYDVLKHIQNPALQKSNLQTLLQTCVKSDAVSILLSLPLEGELVSEADRILLQLAKRSISSGLPSGPPYHEILFAFRAQHSNFRGAAAILYEHLERLRITHRMAILDPDDETLIHIYVLLINTLACCGEEAWLLADPPHDIPGAERKRKLVTLDDIRRDYTAELDRRSDISQGRFPLFGGDEMDML